MSSSKGSVIMMTAGEVLSICDLANLSLDAIKKETASKTALVLYHPFASLLCRARGACDLTASQVAVG
jgi:hypothetical protein